MRYTIPLTLTIDADSPQQARERIGVDLLYLALKDPRGIVDWRLPPVIRITTDAPDDLGPRVYCARCECILTYHEETVCQSCGEG